jgi:type III pantothenate kinase
LDLLADIGNSYAHLHRDGFTIDMSINELVEFFANKKLYYICVNPKISNTLRKIPEWVNLADYVELEGAYSTMGVDRQVLLLSRGDGIYIDAGSAITIDLKKDSKFAGGTILPGIWKQKESYEEISKALYIEEIAKIDIDKLPNSTTKESISFGIIAPVVALVEKINKDNLPIYCCGGDGALLASYIDGAIYERDLVFEGMKKVIKESLC